MAGVGDDDDVALAESRGVVGGVHRRHQPTGIAADAHGEEALLPRSGSCMANVADPVGGALAMRHHGAAHIAVRRCFSCGDYG